MPFSDEEEEKDLLQDLQEARDDYATILASVASYEVRARRTPGV